MNSRTDFDHYADTYDRALGEALAASGEDRQFFAEGRVKWLADCLNQYDCNVNKVLDYGCGTGKTSPLLLQFLGARSAIGIDTSLRSLDVARREHAAEPVEFLAVEEFHPAGDMDLVYCNGVFHHILPELRAGALKLIYQSLKPAGFFAFWENNPWNPGTRYVMAHCPFDGDAITLTAPEARHLLHSQGFHLRRTDFLFIFPRLLSALRPVEKLLTRLPIGAQYLVLCQKPATNQ